MSETNSQAPAIHAFPVADLAYAAAWSRVAPGGFKGWRTAVDTLDGDLGEVWEMLNITAPTCSEPTVQVWFDDNDGSLIATGEHPGKVLWRGATLPELLHKLVPLSEQQMDRAKRLQRKFMAAASPAH